MAPCVNWLVPSSFALPALGTFGDLGKGRLRGPGLFSTDAAVYKMFTVSERMNVQFRAEFFNVFNRANFYTPAAAPGTGVSRVSQEIRLMQPDSEIFCLLVTRESDNSP